MPIPLNNYYVGRKLREVSSYNNASMDLLDDAIPSIILNPSNAGVEVQPAFPKPNANQRLRYTNVKVGSSSTQYQIATPTATTNIYFVGFATFNNAAVSCGHEVYDAASGNPPSFSANTAYQDTAGELVRATLPATIGSGYQLLPPLPQKVTNGIRYQAGGATIDADTIIFYIEETVTAP